MVYFSKGRFPNYHAEGGKYFHTMQGGLLVVEVYPLEDTTGELFLPMVDQTTDEFVHVPVSTMRSGRPCKQE
jgi:hypothetical protein